MSSLEEVYDGGSRWWDVARALFLLLGSLVATVGFVAATASLVAGFGHGKASAIKVAALLGGGLLVVGFLALFARGSMRGRSRTLAVVGVVFAVVGLTLFWTTLPSGWTGHLAELPPIAVGAYAAGLLAVFAAGVADESVANESATDAEGRGAGRRIEDDAADLGSDAESGSLGGVESVMAASARDQDAGPASSAVGDGGEDDEDLQFFDDDGDS